MERASQQIITTSGKSTPIPLDRYVFGYAISVTMNTPGAIYTVQQCFDDPFDFNDSRGNKYSVGYGTSAAWLDSDDPVVVNASTNATSNFAYPPRAVRINASAGVSAANPLVFTITPVGFDG